MGEPGEKFGELYPGLFAVTPVQITLGAQSVTAAGLFRLEQERPVQLLLKGYILQYSGFLPGSKKSSQAVKP